ncbi:acyltransferase [Alkalihalobacillus sp. AL-G]|uniref:acyltransferase n=1 Tax=Alkalihalobacillus sp. AL-G TaxID=2926399 RepID=UPI00272AB46B|nr:acyltransferase [Alkalihalobacillus sp. AL-G]WLD92999.1 acyltransferase [Alkalihalobacillus sp. AL-G]
MRRLVVFDALRFTAVLAVIAIHTTAANADTNLFSFGWNQFARFAVPLFILMSGFLLMGSMQHKTMSVREFYRKRFTKILIPYLIWTVIYTAFSSLGLLKDGQWLQFFKITFLNTITGNGFVHLYFLFVIFQLYLLFPFLKSWIVAKPKQAIIYTFLVTFIVQTAVYAHSIEWIHLPQTGISYGSYFPTWIFFFVFGMFLAIHYKTLEQIIRKQIHFTIGIWIISFSLLLSEGQQTQTFGLSMKPSVMLYCVTSYFMFYGLFLNMQKKLEQHEKRLKKLADSSFMVFLIHPLLLEVGRYFNENYLHLAILEGNFNSVIWFIVVTVLSIGFALIHYKLKTASLLPLMIRKPLTLLG